MTLVRCSTAGCQHRVRQGLRRSGRGVEQQPLADGAHCWRCRAKYGSRPPKRVKRKAAAGAQLELVVEGGDE